MKSSLCLGTVQLGMAYGINNKAGKPTRREAIQILDTAYLRGIRVFDTARAYGDSELVIGEWLAGNKKMRGNIEICSKLSPHVLRGFEEDKSKINEIVELETRESLARLHTDYIDWFMFHTPEYIRNSLAVDAVLRCKEKGIIKNVGVSIYEEADALYAIDKLVDCVQVPFNVLDQRAAQLRIFDIALDSGVKIFARSPFLQGLLLMRLEEIAIKMPLALNYVSAFSGISDSYHISRVEAALQFSLSFGVPIVFGVESISQLNEDIDLASHAPVLECVQNLCNKFVGIEKAIVFPSLWKNDPPKRSQ